MIPTEGLLDKWGPLMVIAFAAYKFLPELVRDIMGVVTQIAQSRATQAEAPYEFAKTVLEQNAKGDLLAIELIGIRTKQDRFEEGQTRIEEEVKVLSQMLKAYIESHKETPNP